MNRHTLRALLIGITVFFSAFFAATPQGVQAQGLQPVKVDGQPLGANIQRLIQAMDYLGTPLPADLVTQVHSAASKREADVLQHLIDPYVLLVVQLNPEVRVKVQRGPAQATLQQGGFTPVLVKVVNDSSVASQMDILSPHAGPIYSGESLNILKRQDQTDLAGKEKKPGDPDRFLQVEMFRSPPMTPKLSGLKVEYAIALIYCQESGQLEATLGFDVGGGGQDLGFRGEVPVLFNVQEAIAVQLSILDHDAKPTAAKLIFRDATGRVYPPQAKRLAPDFFFQPQIYRHDGEVVLLPPGKFTMQYSRGPEYKVLERSVEIPKAGPAQIKIELKRWVDPMRYGFYCGDHHIHGAGCSHYSNPTLGVTPKDMFAQVKGEGLNVGCVLTWGPCFQFQRKFFSPKAHGISEPKTVLKYDLEISGFGSAALGHVCLLNLSDQTYPNSEGTALKGWPTWTVPVLRWTKQQGGYTGYPHSALRVNASAASKFLLSRYDQDQDGQLSSEESHAALLPEAFSKIDQDNNQLLNASELTSATDRVTDTLPNLAIPDLNGGGAMEIFVSAAEGVCDFVSAMDTERIPEWNTWYHLMNCGLPIKLSGETDFPCMSSRRVGQGRVYVQLGKIDRLDFPTWCQGLAEGRSYVSDGFAHALLFSVNDVTPGTGSLQLADAGPVHVRASVAFASEQPQAVAYGGVMPPEGLRAIGDTRILHGQRTNEIERGGDRLVELIVNGKVVAKKKVSADGQVHDLEFDIPITQSSWVALRQFPQLHTNPVDVLVAGKPIRSSSKSAQWCATCIRLLWKNRNRFISEDERPEADKVYKKAIATFERIATEAQQRREQ